MNFFLCFGGTDHDRIETMFMYVQGFDSRNANLIKLFLLDLGKFA